MRIEVLFAGVGGQGIKVLGTLFGRIMFDKGFYSSVIQRYTPEVRGGEIRTEIVVDENEIDFPKIVSPDISVILHDHPYEKYIELRYVVDNALKESKLVIGDANLAKNIPGYKVNFSGEHYYINTLVLGFTLGFLKEKFNIEVTMEEVAETLKKSRIYSERNMAGIRRGLEIFYQSNLV